MRPACLQRNNCAICDISTRSFRKSLQAISLQRRKGHLTGTNSQDRKCCAVPPLSSITVSLQMNRGTQDSESSASESGPITVDVVTPVPSDSEPALTHEQSSEAHEAGSPRLAPTRQDRQKLWFAALKPPMYSVGFIPVMVAAANVFLESGIVPWSRVAGFILAAILVIGWLNLSNDAFDAQTGVDATKPESVVNLLGGSPLCRTAVLLFAKSLLVGGVAILAQLITSSPGGDLRPAVLLTFSIACGYAYQGPPFRLSYKGLGEPLCFLAFGPSATPAFYLALRPEGAAAATTTTCDTSITALLTSVPRAVWACSILVGLTTTAILFCSHFHQIAGDSAAGKRSPLVRLGTERGRKVLRAVVVTTQAAAVAAAAAGILPWAATMATLLAAPAGQKVLAFADENHLVPERVAPLKRFAVKWHIQYGMCLCLGLAAARLLVVAA